MGEEKKKAGPLFEPGIHLPLPAEIKRPFHPSNQKVEAGYVLTSAAVAGSCQPGV